MKTKVCLEDNSTCTLLQAYKNAILNLQALLNELSLSSSSILLPIHGSRKKIAPWKMLQQVGSGDFLSSMEVQIIKEFVKKFLKEEFVFNPLAIIEIN